MTGQLYAIKGRWYYRYWTVVDGKRIRKSVSLKTTDPDVAKTRAARLALGRSPEAARAPETFEQAARRVLQRQSLKTLDERESRLRRYAFPVCGQVSVTELRPAHIRASLGMAAAAGRSRSMIGHLRDDFSTILDALWKDEAVAENWALRVDLPKEAKVDRRRRITLTDAEFEGFMASPVVPEALKLMALVARTLGGARTSELHASDWSHWALPDLASVRLYRPKTDSWSHLSVPAVLVKDMLLWWRSQGRPERGPVFPDRWGGRHGKRSWARELRRALWLAEIRRTDDRKTCPLQVDTPDTRRVDWHSFRRAYNTGLARAGVSVQQAMALAGHADPRTHMRYVGLTEALAAPEEALPRRGS